MHCYIGWIEPRLQLDNDVRLGDADLLAQGWYHGKLQIQRSLDQIVDISSDRRLRRLQEHVRWDNGWCCKKQIRQQVLMHARKKRYRRKEFKCEWRQKQRDYGLNRKLKHAQARRRSFHVCSNRSWNLWITYVARINQNENSTRCTRSRKNRICSDHQRK